MKLPQLKHSRDYYWGLGLLLASCFTLLWALWRDAFKPEVFLGDFLIFSWGYALLWRHDINQRLDGLQKELDELKAASSGREPETVAWNLELPAPPSGPEFERGETEEFAGEP